MPAMFISHRRSSRVWQGSCLRAHCVFKVIRAVGAAKCVKPVLCMLRDTGARLHMRKAINLVRKQRTQLRGTA